MQNIFCAEVHTETRSDCEPAVLEMFQTTGEPMLTGGAGSVFTGMDLEVLGGNALDTPPVSDPEQTNPTRLREDYYSAFLDAIASTYHN